MKRIFVLIVFSILVIFTFNIGKVYAEETINETPVEEVEEKNETIEPKESEVPSEPAVVVEEDNSNTTIIDDSNSTVVNETVVDNNDQNETVINETVVDDTNEPPVTGETNGTSTDEDIHGGEIYDIQKAKVIITKVDEEGNQLSGAVLQIIDSKGTVIDEWTSDGKAHEIQLPDGTYTLHEKTAPEGYALAEDKEFTVKIEVAEVNAGADFSKEPCSHYGDGTPMYYVEIEGKKHEVYCINQNLETPDGTSIYDGELLNASSIKDYTKQTNIVDIDSDNVSVGILSTGPIDVSDPTLDAEQLYNKILDIIYHRHKAAADLAKQGYTYTEEEIRYITEVALKNYTNPGLAEVQRNKAATATLIATFDSNGVVYKRYRKEKDFEEDPNGALVSYLKHNYRDYEYVSDAADNESIVRMVYGSGTSFGQMVAGHWEAKHGADTSGSAAALAARATVARYYALFQYLIRNEDHHPDDMNLYIYSSNSEPDEISGNDHEPGGKYQNLLGVTGYYEEVKQQEIDIEMVNNYSTETRNITVQKVWDDKDNYNNLRPKTVTIKLLVDKVVIDTVEIDETVDWTYTWYDLDKYNNGVEINYTVEEKEVPKYDVEITGDMDTVFILTNSYYGEGGDNPPTGDSIYLYISILLISLIGLIKYTNSYKNN